MAVTNLMSQLETPLSGQAGRIGVKVGAGVGDFGPKVQVSLDKELGLGGTVLGGRGKG